MPAAASTGCDERQEVDHAALIARLIAEYPDGWALSTSSAALREVLALCPPETRVCVWRRRVRVSASRRALSAWEPPARRRRARTRTDAPRGLLDDLETDDVVLDDVLDYRGRYDSFNGALVSMKAPDFAMRMFRQLGARPGDTLDDLYPGSGAIGRARTLYTCLRGDVRLVAAHRPQLLVRPRGARLGRCARSQKPAPGSGG